MNLEQKVVAHIIKFVDENFNELSRFTGESKEELNKDSLLVKPLFEEIFTLIFGDNLNGLKFNLKNHFRYIDQQTWEESRRFAELNPRFKFDEKNLKDKLSSPLFFGMSHVYGSKEKNLPLNEKALMSILNMFGIEGDRLKNLFEDVSCHSCDQYFRVEFDTESKEFTVPESVGACPCGEHKMKFTLDLPSQELILVNDIRSAFHLKRKDEYKNTVNSIYGKILECEEYLKHNIAYISLGSGGIDVLHSKDEKKIVMDLCEQTYYEPLNEDSSEEDEDDYWDEDKKPKDGFKKVGDISLELWGVFMMDKSVYKKICKEKGFTLDSFDTVNVKVKGTKLEVDYDLDELLIEMKYS